MLRKLVLLVFFSLVPILKVVYQEVNNETLTAELEVKVVANNSYQGTLYITIEDEVAGLIEGTVELPFAIGQPTYAPNDQMTIRVEKLDISPVRDTLQPQTRLHVSLEDPASSEIKITFPIEPLRYLPVEDPPFDRSPHLGRMAYLVLEEIPEGFGRLYQLHFRLASHSPALIGTIVPSRVVFSWEEGIRIRSINRTPGVPIDNISKRLTIPIEFYETDRLSIIYSLPPPSDVQKTLRLSLLALMVICDSLIPVSLVYMSNFIQNQLKRIGVGVGLWFGSLVITLVLWMTRIINTENMIVALVASIAALLFIVFSLVMRGSSDAAGWEGKFPDDLSALPIQKLRELRHKCLQHRAHLENQRAIFGEPHVPFYIVHSIDALKEQIAQIDAEIAQRRVDDRE